MYEQDYLDYLSLPAKKWRVLRCGYSRTFEEIGELIMKYYNKSVKRVMFAVLLF